MAEGAGYSGWLGGYAKSVAGSVSAFTQDILEDTRSETQDVNSLLKHSNEKVAECEAKILALETEILKFKSELKDVAEDKEVAELQLQEVAGRWKSILKEKDDELNGMKEKLDELETDRNTEKRSEPRLRSVSAGDIDFSDALVCEMEIGRLAKENQSLLNKVKKLSSPIKTDDSTDRNKEESEEKIMALQAQLRSVYIEHENELALKEQETDRIVASLKEELQHSSEKESGEIDSEDNRINDKYSELQLQYKREQEFFKQLEEEKNALDSQLGEANEEMSKLKVKNLQLSSQSSELENSEENVRILEEKVAALEAGNKNSTDVEATVTQYNNVVMDLNKDLASKSEHLTAFKSKLSASQQLVSNKDKEIAQLRIALNTVKSEDFQELRGLVDSLKMQVDGYKESLKETGHKLLQSHKQEQTLTTESVELRANISCLEADNGAHKENIKQCEIQIKTKDDFISELQQTCSGLRKSLSDNTQSTATLTAQHDSIVKLSNQLKAEKVELVVESKKSRDELTSVRLENQQLSSDMSQLERNPLFHLLEYEDLSHVQMLDIKEIVESENDRQTDGQTPGQGSSVVELRAVRRKLADKSEQLQLLQGTISKLRSEREGMISRPEHENSISDMKSGHIIQIGNLEDKMTDSTQQIAALVQKHEELREINQDLESVNCELQNEVKDAKDNLKQMNLSSYYEEELEEKLKEFKFSADKEKTRLLEEIQRLVEEADELEEVYTVTVTEKEGFQNETSLLHESVKLSNEEKIVREEKLGKVTESLKKAQARLTVKDAKIDELSDQLATLEKKLTESSELVEFYKSNQTDECKAAQLGLTELSEVSSFPVPVSDVTSYVTDDVSTYVTDAAATKEVLKLKQELSDVEGRYEKLADTYRDKDLRIDFLEAEIASSAELSQLEVDTSKLIDQNMAFQKSNLVLVRELEGVKAQNMELLHQRDFYQEQAKQFHESMEKMKAEASKLINDANDRENKCAAELERLQDHLVKAEQSHAEDFISATQSEQDLRLELVSLREQVLTLNQSLDSARSVSSQDMSDVTSQLHVACKQRDEALLQLNSLEEQTAFYQTSLTNLQIALEQFQQDREGYASEVLEQNKRDLQIVTSQLMSAQSTISIHEARISEMKLIEEDFRVFKDDSKTKDDRIKCLQREVSKLDVALKVAQEGLQKVRCTSEDKVERSLMKAFFTQYLTAPDTRKPEVLRLMTSILNYSDEELESLHHSRDKKWLSNVLPTAPFNASPQDASPGQSFSELFVSFLETEANRGSVMGSRPLNTPPLLQRANNAASRQRSPSSASFHQRSPSSASTTSTHSLPVLASKDPPVTGERPSEPGPLQQTIHSSPLVVPASLADLLSNKPR